MGNETPTSGQAGAVETKPYGTRPFRHSVDLNQQFKDTSISPSDVVNAPSTMAPPVTQVPATPPKLQTSFSANDVPTVKNAGVTSAPAPASANAHAQQHFHNHNASIGRIPPGATKRHSRELSGDVHANVSQAGAYPSISSQLQGNAPAFSSGPPATQGATSAASAAGPPALGGYPSYYNTNYQPPTTGPGPNGNGYNNMPMLAMGMQNMNLGGYPPQAYAGYGAVYQNAIHGGQPPPAHAGAGAPRDSQQRVIQQRRLQDSEG